MRTSLSTTAKQIKQMWIFWVDRSTGSWPCNKSSMSHSVTHSAIRTCGPHVQSLSGRQQQQDKPPAPRASTEDFIRIIFFSIAHVCWRSQKTVAPGFLISLTREAEDFNWNKHLHCVCRCSSSSLVLRTGILIPKKFRVLTRKWWPMKTSELSKL